MRDLLKMSSTEKKFTTLCSFVNEMSAFFNKDLALKLYNHLLVKTTLADTVPVEKHISEFTDFCKNNRKHILEANTALPQKKINYSERVYIDFEKIISEILKEDSAAETLTVLFDHLLLLSSVFDPEGNASEVIKNKAQSDDKTSEIKEFLEGNEFLSGMMKKVESQVDPGSNPMEAMSKMMSSGLLQELVVGMQENIDSGKMNVQDLMTSVQKMTTALPPDQMAALQPMLGMAMSADKMGASLSRANGNPTTQPKLTAIGPPRPKETKSKKKRKKKKR